MTALALGAVVVLATACSSGGGSGDSGSSKGSGSGNTVKSEKPTTSAAVLTVTPKDGATGVATNDSLKISVASGKLTKVTVADVDGNAVEGEVSSDGLSWKPATHLRTGTKYQVNAIAQDSNGLQSARTTSFTTMTPAHTFSAVDNIKDNGTYGVGMIVSVTFDKRIKNKEAIENAITFETNPKVEVKGHWMGSQRLDFRPENYWKPGTKVTIKYHLDGVKSAPGVYGDIQKDEPFTIGRSQISTVNVKTLKMTVKRGGKTTATYPVTTGKAGYESWNGTMVIESKERVTRMTGGTGGDEYDVPDVPHAMRLTNTGTYTHGNYWAAGAFGNYNASHGCIGLRDTKGGSDSTSAGKFYNNSLIGDIVKVINSKGDTVQPDNGLSGWNMSWAAW